ncbi:MAG: HpaII family restriction endonuclease [Bacteroidales bacterium]
MNFTGNKEDWMQIYALFYLMGVGKLINREILDIFRTDAEGTIRYQFSEGNIVCFFERKEFDRIPAKEFANAAKQIFDDVKVLEAETEVELPYAAELLNRLHLTDLYSYSEDKSAFTVRTVEGKRDLVIRSKFNGGCTILASHRAGNLKYEIQNLKLNGPTAKKLNGISGDNAVMARMIEIFRLYGKLKFSDPENKYYKNSLSLIDLHFPKLFAEMMKLFYTTELISLKDILEEVKAMNPFKINDDLINKHHFYEYKVKQYLIALVFGFKPSKMWKGKLSDNIPLFIEKDGKITFFGPAYREELENYLFENARFRMPDNPDKHKFGLVEKENSLYYFTLNADIVIK